jgi:hypothetical protein
VTGPRRLAIIAAALSGTVILVGCGIAAVAGFSLSDTKNIHASPIGNQATGDIDKASSKAVSAVAAAAPAGASQMPAAETPPVQVAMANVPDLPNGDAEEAVSSAETPDEPSYGLSQTIAPETQPVQIATASVDDVVHGDFKGAVSAESPPDSSHALAVETPPDGKEEATPTGTQDQCLAREACIDQYLWSVYQRAPKEGIIRNVERRKVTADINGKPQTVVKEFTTIADEDFAWKDPKAAEKAGMSLMEYVIGGMDRDFKLRLYRAVRAMDDAGLSPGITSAFRDDYRQSLASGLKAANNRSFHGGSLRGGYGHGLAADIVSVKGETRAERNISSEGLWKWIDAHGKEFGIGRPYLDKDPGHVAPIDGQEYASHRRGANTQHARSETKTRNLLAVRDDHSIAKLARAARSSGF